MFYHVRIRYSVLFLVIFIWGALFMITQTIISMPYLKHSRYQLLKSQTNYHYKNCLIKVTQEVIEMKTKSDLKHEVSFQPRKTIPCSPFEKFQRLVLDLMNPILMSDVEETKEEYFKLPEYENHPWLRKKSFQGITSNTCPVVSPLLRGPMNITFNDTKNDDGSLRNWPPTLEEMSLKFYKSIRLGGEYEPFECKCRGTSAIIVPFRDRHRHLRYFLFYMHKILRRQQLCYVIIVVEQNDGEVFNKGQLMNAGFVYARNSMMEIDCFIFHDVDTIPEDDRIIYTCEDGKLINHFAHKIDKFDYNFTKDLTVGGAVGFTKNQFEDVNGYSNLYWGWGGEDDDMDVRIKRKSYLIFRSKMDYIKFKMIKHDEDKGNPKNPIRHKLLEEASLRQDEDGLNSLNATISSVVRYPTHTRLKVILFHPNDRKEKSKQMQMQQPMTALKHSLNSKSIHWKKTKQVNQS